MELTLSETTSKTQGQALDATRENGRRNDVEDRMDLLGTALDVTAQTKNWDRVMANILAGPLVTLADTLAQACRPGGALGLSGLLIDQGDEVRAAYARHFEQLTTHTRDGWLCVEGRRRT